MPAQQLTLEFLWTPDSLLADETYSHLVHVLISSTCSSHFCHLHVCVCPTRPTFRQLVQRLDTMLRQNRMLKKRSASGPAGTGCATSTPASMG